VTAKAEARFRAPAQVGSPLVITGRVTQTTSRALRARAEIRCGGDNGPLVAELEALMALTRGREDSPRS
jgi:acyl-CoA thioesterase FadM